MWAESTAKGGVKERLISSIYTLNFETKSILSDRAWVNLESSGIFFCVFLGFGYKITDKPRIPSDNLDPASMSCLYLPRRGPLIGEIKILYCIVYLQSFWFFGLWLERSESTRRVSFFSSTRSQTATNLLSVFFLLLSSQKIWTVIRSFLSVPHIWN